MRLLIGLFMIVFLSPVTLFFAESQDIVKDFKNGRATTGTPQVEEVLSCPDESGDCFYIKTKIEEQVTSEKEICGDLPENAVVINSTEEKCDGEGNCEPCYLTEQTTWQLLSETEQSSITLLEGKTVNFESADLFFGSETKMSEADGLRTTETFLPLNDTMTLVEGERTFITNMNYEASLAAAKVYQKTLKWSMRIGALFIMVMGFLIFSSQFVEPLLGVFKVVPFLGGVLSGASKSLIYFVMALLATAVWAVLLVLMMIFTNIWLVMIVAALALAGIIWKVKNTNPKGKTQKKK